MRTKYAIPLAIAALVVTAMICVTGVTADDLNASQSGVATNSQIIMNGSVAPMTLVLENHTYYPNDTVRIFVYNATDPAVNITDPSGVVYNLTAIPINDSAFAFQYVLDQGIILANYTVQATDNATGAYAVDTFQVTTRQIAAAPLPENQTQGTPSLYLYLNISRPNYRPGDAVGITATTNAGTPAIVIQDPVNNMIYQNVVAEGNETYLTTFNLNRAVVLGNYTVTAYVSGNGIYDNTTAYFNVSLATPTANSNLQVRYAAYDPVQKAIVVRASINSLASNVTALVNGSPIINGMNVKSIKVFSPNSTGNVLQGTGQASAYEDVDIVIPVNNSNVGNVTGRFNLTPDIAAATTSMSINANGTDIHISLNNTTEGSWYRLSASIPAGYTVQKIVRDDGTEITNDVQVNRSTGETTSDNINWYVDNGTLYFYDDPINGYDVTLSPPLAHNSLAVNVIYGGQLSAIVYPYNQTDNNTVIASNDDLGRIDDNGYGDNIDADAGSKTAVRMYENNNVNSGDLMMFGNDGDTYHTYSSANYNYTNAGDPTIVGFNTVPDGSVESVYISNFTTPNATYAPSTVNITQKTIIRNNNLWFATVYYITNTGGSNISDFRFYQGCDFNFNGQYSDDIDYYDTVNDTVFGHYNSGSSNAIQTGGYRSTLASSMHDVCQYGTMWTRVASDGLLNDTSTPADTDGGMALSWDDGTLKNGTTWVVPVIWAVGYNNSSFSSNLNYAINHNIYDTGIRSIDGPSNGSSLSSLTTPSVTINATAMDLGVTDQSPTVVCQIKNSTGGTIYNSSTTVSLSVPYRETSPVSFNWNLSGVAPGMYNISVYTNLTNSNGTYIDQNSSNDMQSITVYVQNFSLYPGQTIQANPGQNVAFSLNLSNSGIPSAFDLSISPSTYGWTSNLYYNNLSTLLATDTNGDGTWDWINTSYIDPSTGVPSIIVPTSTNATLILQKLVPANAGPGMVDTITLSAYPSGKPLMNSSAVLNTITQSAGMANKTFYLHSLYLNTTPPSASTGDTSITAGSSMWSQTPAFASNFIIAGNISVPLYYNSTATATLPVTVTLFYTNGAGNSVSIGSNTSSLSASTTVSLFNFTITSPGSVTVPRGDYLILKIDNQQTTALNVWYTNTYRSRINVNTTTYVNVGVINTYDGGVQSSLFYPNDTIYITANVTDPIGAYDIANATISITAPNGTLVLNSQYMTLNLSDTNVPALWKLYNCSYKLNSTAAGGAYTINITGVESNGVKCNTSTTFYVSYPINVSVSKSFSLTSGSTFNVTITVTNKNNNTISGVHAYDFYASDFSVAGFSQPRTATPVNNGFLHGDINIFGPFTLLPYQSVNITYTAQGIGNYNLANMAIVGVDPDV
jgi:hypothetical protein